MIRWLHISDLHFGSGGMATEMLRDELPRYLRSKGLCCDYVFCTGDVRTANVAHNEFSDEMAEYVRTLCSAVGVPVENFFMEIRPPLISMWRHPICGIGTLSC